MAEFVTVMRERERMCHEGCTRCPLETSRNGFRVSCGRVVEYHPEEAEKIIMDWAAKHPAETMKDRFFKMFPNAPKDDNGTPRGCPSSLGWAEVCSKNMKIENCVDCWNRPYEERNVNDD